MIASVRSWGFVAALALCGGVPAQTLVPGGNAGGQIAQPIAVGDYLYVPSGTAIEVWRVADPAHPSRLGRSSGTDMAPGPIGDMATVAGHLYASWYASDGTRGVSIYSLADPTHPARVGAVDGGFAEHVASNAGHLYLAGSSIGVVAYGLTDPEHPTPLGIADGFPIGFVGPFVVQDERMLVGSANWFGDWFFALVDLADPAHPHGMYFPDGSGLVDWVLDGDNVIVAGQGFWIYDAHDPANPELIFSQETSPATRALIDGNVLYLFGAGQVEAWDISAPANTARLGSAPTDLFAVTNTTLTPHGPFAIDAAGRGTLLDDTSPVNPRVGARIDVPGGGIIEGAALDARYAYLADPAFGLRIVSSPDFEPVGAIAIGEAEARGAHDAAVQDGIAYVIGWEGLHAIDVADPAHPVEIGSVAAPFFHRVVVDGDRAYLTMINQLTTFMVVDIADPAQMRTMGSMFLDNPYDLVVRGNRVYAATEGGLDGGGGLRIVDVSNPDAPVQIGADATCGSDIGMSVALAGSADDELVIGCLTGTMHILDVGDPSAPVSLGALTLPDNYNAVIALAASGDTVYVGHAYGVDEVDISDPAAPVRVARYETTWQVNAERISSNGLIALTGLAGTYSYQIPSASNASPRHSHHARPARLALEP